MPMVDAQTQMGVINVNSSSQTEFYSFDENGILSCGLFYFSTYINVKQRRNDIVVGIVLSRRVG